MIQTLTKNWWLLALCGSLEAILACVYLLMQDADGALTLRTYAVKSTVVLVGRLSLAAGICAIMAGMWRSATGRSWLLVLNGFALSMLGVMFSGVFGPRISLRSIALLLLVTAISAGILELISARTLPGHGVDRWFWSLAGAASMGFAVMFAAWTFAWIKPGPGASADFLWIGSYFGFSAICMLGVALRLHRWGSLPSLSNPGHAH